MGDGGVGGAGVGGVLGGAGWLQMRCVSGSLIFHSTASFFFSYSFFFFFFTVIRFTFHASILCVQLIFVVVVVVC